MEKLLKKIICIVSFAIIIFCANIEVKASNIGGGSCGKNATWVLTSDGILEISGEGEVYERTMPWDNYAEDIKVVKIGEGITNIPRYAFNNTNFEDYSNIRSVSMADTVEEIGDYAFQGCEKIQRIKFSKNLRTIGQQAFDACEMLEEVNIPNKLTQLGSSTKGGAFARCKNLKKISLGSVEEIGFGCFMGCESLEKIYIPISVKKIDDYAFSECTALKEIEFEESDITGNGMSIGQAAFSECENLEIINFPIRITKIYGSSFSFPGAFADCTKLKKIVFGAELNQIENGAFARCDSLQEIYFCGNAPIFGSSSSDIVFPAKTILAFYPKNNNTWTPDKLANHGAENIEWKTWNVPIEKTYVANSRSSIVKSGIEIAWEVNTNAEGYVIYRQIDGGKWQKYKIIPSEKIKKYIDKKVKNGKLYSYKVHPYKGNGIGKADNCTLGIIFLSKPQITYIKKNGSSMRVKWNKNKKAQSYIVEYSTKKTFSNGSTTKLRTTQNSLTLFSGNKYYVRVMASPNPINSTKYRGGSCWSEIKSAK